MSYLVSRESSEHETGDKPSVFSCGWYQRNATGTVPDKTSDDSTYGGSKPFTQSGGIRLAHISASWTLPDASSYKHDLLFLVRTSCNSSNNMAGSSSSRQMTRLVSGRKLPMLLSSIPSPYTSRPVQKLFHDPPERGGQRRPSSGSEVDAGMNGLSGF